MTTQPFPRERTNDPRTPDQNTRTQRHSVLSPTRWGTLGMVVLLGVGCLQSPYESVPDVEGIEVSVGTDSFQQEVLDSELPVLVDFGATWCGPCKKMDPMVKYLSSEYEGRVKVAKVDADDSPGLTADYGIDGLPTFIIFQDGREVGRTVGSQPYFELTRFVDQNIEAISDPSS